MVNRTIVRNVNLYINKHLAFVLQDIDLNFGITLVNRGGNKTVKARKT